MTVIIDGKKVAIELLEKLKNKTKNLKKKPSLAVILANNNQASKIYVNSKEKQALYLGFKSNIYHFDQSIDEKKIIQTIKELNADPEINGILVQLPLFKHLDEQKIIEIIDPKKDVDGFHPENMGKLILGLKPYSICCTPKGILKLLDYYKIDIEGKNALVIGRSNIVGKPTAMLLTNRNATVTLAHSKTQNLKKLTKKADIIISATGQANIIKKDMVSRGAVVIDVGINRLDNGKLCGDVDFNKVKNIASYITPVPGGVGPMTIACLLENTYELYLEQNK